MTNDPNNTSSNQQYYQQPYQGGYETVPNSTSVLVLGILTIVFCWCYGILSVILGIIALVLANSGEKEYKLSPHRYSATSYKNLRSGKTCAIVGLCLAAISLIIAIIWLVVFGSVMFNVFSTHFPNQY
jgi:hypothetical protein